MLNVNGTFTATNEDGLCRIVENFNAIPGFCTCDYNRNGLTGECYGRIRPYGLDHLEKVLARLTECFESCVINITDEDDGYQFRYRLYDNGIQWVEEEQVISYKVTAVLYSDGHKR